MSLPLFQFTIYRWYVRLGMWAWFLWKVSRAPLALNPAHPDKCGGLGFLSSLLLCVLAVARSRTAF